MHRTTRWRFVVPSIAVLAFSVAACGPGGGGGGALPGWSTSDSSGGDSSDVDAREDHGRSLPDADGLAEADSPSPDHGAEGTPLCTPACDTASCGPDGCGGNCGACPDGETCDDGSCLSASCQGAAQADASGDLMLAQPMSFEEATVLVTHKVDVDPHEDGCLSQVTIVLGKALGCTLRVEAGRTVAPDGSLPISRIEFVADSQCPGFDDADEGIYDDASGLTVARIVPGLHDVPGDNMSQACVATVFRVQLQGSLSKGDGAIALSWTDIAVAGTFMSQGSTDEQCPCEPSCSGRVCGDDGCGGTCGGCPTGLCDDSSGQCVCQPHCADKACGDDGCGGSCGSCSALDSCVGGQCQPCQPQCSGKVCGPDGCGGVCGDCGAGASCTPGGQCECVPNCSGKSCGDDGCGGSCGTCGGSSQCGADGLCQCIPVCSGDGCGDGCGGTCGASCPSGASCNQANGQCTYGMGACEYFGHSFNEEWASNDDGVVSVIQNSEPNAAGYFNQLQVWVYPDSDGDYPTALSTTTLDGNPATCTVCVNILTGCLPGQGCTRSFAATSGSVSWLAFGANFGFINGSVNATLVEVTGALEPTPGGSIYCLQEHGMDAFHL